MHPYITFHRIQTPVIHFILLFESFAYSTLCVFIRGKNEYFEWFDITFSSVGLSVLLKVLFYPCCRFPPTISADKVKKASWFHTGLLITGFIAWQNVFCVKSNAVASKFEAFCDFPISLCERTNFSFFMLEWSSDWRLKWKG